MSTYYELQSNRVQDAEQLMENTKVLEAASNPTSSYEIRNSFRNRCGPSANLEDEADKEDGPMNSHQSDYSDEIEATSSNNIDKQSSPQT
ncbi:hypothetical protein ACP4OV_005766 [Aristida adscensionis]